MNEQIAAIEREYLVTLRTFGPCSNAEVSRKMGMRMDAGYVMMLGLVKMGYAAQVSKQAWEITESGKTYLLARIGQEVSLFEDV